MARCWVVQVALQLEEELFSLVGCLMRLSIASVILLAVGWELIQTFLLRAWAVDVRLASKAVVDPNRTRGLSKCHRPAAMV